MKRLNSAVTGKAAGIGVLAALLNAGIAHAGVISGTVVGNDLAGGSRWDYAPRQVSIFGQSLSRSLSDGLSYSMQGGGYAAYRDLFSWSGAAPSVSAFQVAVEQAFGAWTAVDTASSFGTKLSFSHTPSVGVVGIGTNGALLSIDGNEIDLFGNGSIWNSSANSIQGLTSVGELIDPVTLTSEVANYAGSRAITGADIIMNSNPGAQYTLDSFRRILTHEIGHAIGLSDVDVGSVKFIDNNFDGSSAATIADTLNDSWVHLVDPLNPAASGLQVYTIASSVFTTTGVNLLMESRGAGISAANPVGNPIPLTNDEFGTRQFLYPELAAVPEPHEYALFGIGLMLVLARAGRKMQETRKIPAHAA